MNNQTVKNSIDPQFKILFELQQDYNLATRENNYEAAESYSALMNLITLGYIEGMYNVDTGDLEFKATEKGLTVGQSLTNEIFNTFTDLQKENEEEEF